MTETLPIDSLMIDRWTNQWMKQLGFNHEQLLKRNNKVEQFSRFVLDRIRTKKSIDITKREQLLLETLREYEHRLSRTGFENDVSEEFENMKLKQKELFIEKKHQELDTERLTTIKSYRTRLNDLCNRLDVKPDNLSIICQLIDEKYESCLTTDSLGQIESFLNKLECKSEEQEKYVNTLVGNLEKLYAKLARDDASPPKRSAAYILRHNTAETVKQLENEIAQLQAKRMATSQAYCESMRKKIEELYEQCQIGSFERRPIDFENVTPETLDECDREYDRLDDMYHVRKPILNAFEQWKVLVQQRGEFQKKSSSAARFHERGYSAVKEQAERKRFAIALPKAERTCLNILEQWEKEHTNEQFLINDIPIRQIIEQQSIGTSNMTATTVSNPPTTISKTVSASSISSTAVPQRTLSKNNIRKKSLRNVVKQTVEQQVSKSRHDEIDEDTLDFTQIENIKHINGLPRIVTSTPKTGKNNRSHTVVDIGRNKNNDPIQKRRPSKRIPTRR
ncbi:unnamed protein product [Rotaria sp. Silwood2]|nr:unnamed protein product [Rotaria sp. Silwood2]